MKKSPNVIQTTWRPQPGQRVRHSEFGAGVVIGVPPNVTERPGIVPVQFDALDGPLEGPVSDLRAERRHFRVIQGGKTDMVGAARQVAEIYMGATAHA